MLLNRDRANRLMQKYGLQVLVAATPQHVTYASDAWMLGQWSRPSQASAFVVLPMDGDPTVILSMGAVECAYSKPTKAWPKDIRFYGKPWLEPASGDVKLDEVETRIDKVLRESVSESDAITCLIEVIRERGFDKKKIGIDDLGLGYSLTDRHTITVGENSKEAASGQVVARYPCLAGNQVREDTGRDRAS